jgi:hypothetical protein
MAAPGSNDGAAPEGVAADGKMAWEIMKTCERLAPRFTLGDVMLASSSSFSGTAEDMRSSLVRIAHLAGAHVEVEAVTGEVIYVFPRRVRAAVLSRNAIENNRAFRRRAWRGFLTAFRFCFSVFLVVSVVLVFLALVAIMIIALTQSRDRGGGGGQLPLFFGPGGPGGGGGGGGPYYHHHGGLNDNFWLYLYMRDIWWLTYWNEHEYRMHQRLHGEYGRGLRHGQPAKGAGGGAAPPGGDGGGGGGGGGRGQGGGGGGGGGGGRRPGPPDRDPPGGPGADWDRFLAEEDEAERGDGDKNRELSFIESVFAFVFGRGDPNEDLEHRRWRAVGLLLRANEGAVYAEQLAPFLDSYLLRDHRGRGGLDALAAMVRNMVRKIVRRKDDEARGDASRMHEGYVLEALAKFGGHAESSEDGRLVYVFPALQVSTLEDHEGSGGGGTDQSRSRPIRTLPPPIPPPIFERARPVWEGGEKTPLVVGLGLINLVMVLLFKRVGGMDFRAPRRPLGIRARKTMGRKIAPGHRYDSGVVREQTEQRLRDQAETVQKAKAAADAATKAGEDPVAAAKAAGGEIVYETVPATIRFLEMFPWMCSKLYPLLFWYAVVFFAVPCVRAAYCAWENGNIKRRNDARRERAGAALREIVAAREEKGRAAAGRKNFIKIVDEDDEPDGGA